MPRSSSLQTDLFNHPDVIGVASQKAKRPLKVKKSQFAKKPDRFGGNLRTTRASRTFRPVSTKTSMHLNLKSTQAVGKWSFLTPRNKVLIKKLLKAHAQKYNIQVLSSANVGNHLHIHLQTRTTQGFKAFIRAFSGAVALKVTGASKINKLKNKFWTQTPYTRFVHGVKDCLKLQDYLRINILEGFGVPRRQAEYMIRQKMWPELEATS